MSKRSVREDHCPSGLGRQFNVVRTHAYTIADLPEPGEEWTFRDEHIGLDKSERRVLKHRGVIIKTRRGNASKDEPHYWTVDADAYEYASDLADDENRLSCCGATGIVNDGGTIRCNKCGVAVTREEAREVLG